MPNSEGSPVIWNAGWITSGIRNLKLKTFRTNWLSVLLYHRLIRYGKMDELGRPAGEIGREYSQMPAFCWCIKTEQTETDFVALPRNDDDSGWWTFNHLCGWWLSCVQLVQLKNWFVVNKLLLFIVVCLKIIIYCYYKMFQCQQDN